MKPTISRKGKICRFCGSSMIRMNVEVNSGLTIEKILDPEITIPELSSGLPLTFRGGKIGKMKSKEFHFKVPYCNLCKNINVVDFTEPKKITSNIHKAEIIIPSILNEQLEIHEYDPHETIQLINSVTKRLEKIYNKWSQRGGTNRCRGNHVGEKIKIALKSGLKIPCWVIVETICRKIVFRLCYGGSNVNCD